LAALVVAGCETLDSFTLTYFSSTTAGRERVVTGSVDGVARSVQGVLEEAGMEATVKRDGATVRVLSRTPQGQKFAMVLTRASEGKTRVRIDWDGVADDGTGFALLARLGTASAP
jgi:hypothetical protein